MRGVPGDLEAAVEVAGLAGLPSDGLRLVSSTSRLIWHCPDGNAAITVTRPSSRTYDQVAFEIRMIDVLRETGVRTPHVLGGPFHLPGQRLGHVTEWITHVPPRTPEIGWHLVAEQASRVASANPEGIDPLFMPDVSDTTWDDLLGRDLSARFAERWNSERNTLTALLSGGDLVVSHGDLHPGNALIDSAGLCWLIDLERVSLVPSEWDHAILTILAKRFGDPTNLDELLAYWPPADPERLAACIRVREIIIVGGLLRQGHTQAVEEAVRRLHGVLGQGPPWQHLHDLPPAEQQ